MSKYTVVDSSYNKETGVSTVTINSRWGGFTGTAKVAEEDRDIQSEFRGADFAEYKAYIKLLKTKGKAYLERAKGVQEAIDVLDFKHRQMDDFNFAISNKIGMMRVRDNIIARADECFDLAKKMEEKYPEYCNAMLTAKRKIAEKYHKE